MNADNISDLGNKIIGFWTRQRLDAYAVALKGLAWIQFFKCNLVQRLGYTEKADLMKLTFRKRFQHFYPWGMEDYIALLERTEEKRVAILKAKASFLCHQCYGRGRKGFNQNTGTFIVCDCVKKKLREESLAAYNDKWYRKSLRWIKKLFKAKDLP